jgi:hypothetical protein
MRERFDVIVVGSGAGGGTSPASSRERTARALAGMRPAPHGRRLHALEAKATHDLFWPIRFALIDGGAGGAVAGPSSCVHPSAVRSSA